MGRSAWDQVKSFFGSLPPAKKKQTKRGIDPAKVDRLTSTWTTTSLGPNYEVRQSLAILRARSRNLATTDEYIKRFFHLLKQNVCGEKGIQLAPKFVDPATGEVDKNANEKLRNAWSAWGRKGSCTMDGRLTFKDFQRLFLPSIARDGEQMIRHIRGRSAGNDFNYSLQLIEPDHLDHTYERNLRGFNRIVMGVETDSYHRALAYHFLTQHPGESISAGTRTMREVVNAKDVIHPFISERVNQIRGIPWIHAAMWRLQMIGGYEEAELVSSRASSAKMGFYYTPDGDPPPGTDDESEDHKGEFVNDAEPGTFEILPKGYDVKEYDPQHPNSSFKDFMKAVLRGISSGINVSYPSLANDLEGVNFSSIRQAVLDDRDAWRCLQDWFSEQVLQPIYEEWLLMALTSNQIDLPARKIEQFIYPRWKARGWSWVDPLKEVKANIEAIDKGLKSRQDVMIENGRDLDDTFNELAEEQSLAAKLGISIDKVVTNGNDNDITQDKDE